MRKSRLKIVLATLLAIFNLFTCFAGTYAWFVAARVNNVSSMQVQMYTHELDMSYSIYKYSDEQKAGIRSNDLVLQEYDSVIKSRNVYTPIIIEFMITGMSLGDGIPVFINTHCTNNTTTDNVLSNIIQMKFAVIPTITSSDPNVIYFDAIAAFEDEDPNYFIVDDEKQQDIEYELSNYSGYITGGNLRLYILLDYCEDLIDNFDFVFGSSESTAFTNDLQMITCRTEENED